MAIWDIRRLCNIERQFFKYRIPDEWDTIPYDPDILEDSAAARIWHWETVPRKGQVGPQAFSDLVSRGKARAQRLYEHIIEALEHRQKVRLAKPVRPPELIPAELEVESEVESKAELMAEINAASKAESKAQSESEPVNPAFADPEPGDTTVQTAEIVSVSSTNQKPNHEIGFVSQKSPSSPALPPNGSLIMPVSVPEPVERPHM
jgi:hypothetical protein